MLSFLGKQLTVKKLYLLVILASSFVVAWYYLTLPSSVVNYNFVYKIEVSNSTAIAVTNDNWSIRTPIEFDTPVWKDISLVSLPPFSRDEITLSINGTQSYPDIANALLKKQTHPAHKNIGLNGEYLSIEDINNWVHLQLSYVGVQSQPLKIHQLLKSKLGDCTEFTLLAYYKLLSQGYQDVIPVEGFHFPLNQNRIVTSSNFHAWLLVKIDREWWVIDPLYKKMHKPSSEYLVMNLMREGESLPLIQNSKLSVKLK